MPQYQNLKLKDSSSIFIHSIHSIFLFNFNAEEILSNDKYTFWNTCYEGMLKTNFARKVWTGYVQQWKQAKVKVVTIMNVKTTISWDVILCTLVEKNETTWHHTPEDSNYQWESYVTVDLDTKLHFSQKQETETWGILFISLLEWFLKNMLWANNNTDS